MIASRHNIIIHMSSLSFINTHPKYLIFLSLHFNSYLMTAFLSSIPSITSPCQSSSFRALLPMSFISPVCLTSHSATFFDLAYVSNPCLMTASVYCPSRSILIWSDDRGSSELRSSSFHILISSSSIYVRIYQASVLNSPYSPRCYLTYV